MINLIKYKFRGKITQEKSIGGIRIEEGVNIASHTCIYTHSSQDSIRLLGDKFIDVPADQRIGKGDFSDFFSILVGNPAKRIGDTRKTDQKHWQSGVDFSNYFDQSLLSEFSKHKTSYKEND